MTGCEHNNKGDYGTYPNIEWCKECGAINNGGEWKLPRSSIPMIIQSDQKVATIVVPYCLPMIGYFRFDANLFAKYRNTGVDGDMSNTYVLTYFGLKPDEN